ncbi:hypothetical protein ES702_05482 [subsurface metagenome]
MRDRHMTSFSGCPGSKIMDFKDSEPHPHLFCIGCRNTRHLDKIDKKDIDKIEVKRILMCESKEEEN